MKSLFSLLVVCALGAVFFNSCKTKAVADRPIHTVTLKASYEPKVSNINLIINSATVKDSILTLDVSYTQPCGDYGFALIAESKMSKSLPPQTNIFLVEQVGNQTGCKSKKKKRETLQFNINPVRINGQSKVVLVLNDGKQVEFNYFPFVSID